MHHGITYMYINFQQNRVCRSVNTVNTNLFDNIYRKVHKLATTNSIFFKLMTSDMRLRKTYIAYKEDFIENQQKRRLTNTIYRTIYKIYIKSTTNFKIQTLNIIKKLLWSVNNKK